VGYSLSRQPSGRPRNADPGSIRCGVGFAGLDLPQVDVHFRNADFCEHALAFIDCFLVGFVAPYLNNVIEQDHRFIKKRITASLGFRSVEGACRTIAGYEAMHATRKGQVRWVAKGDAVAQHQFIHTIFGITA
jgi:hypothetical protein